MTPKGSKHWEFKCQAETEISKVFDQLQKGVNKFLKKEGFFKMNFAGLRASLSFLAMLIVKLSFSETPNCALRKAET